MNDPLVLVLSVVFALSSGVCVYVYFGYPALLAVVARRHPRPVAKAPVRPSVSFIVPAYNEQRVIEAKVRNTLGQEYPADRLEVLVASDGSDDRTDEIVRSIDDPRVKLLALPRQGKMRAINDAAAAASGEILVFSDASVMLEGGALAHLVESFADPEVGAVTGSKKMVAASADADVTAEGEGLYWRYENRLKELESTIGSCYIGDGSLHSVRRTLFRPITQFASSDDMVISMNVVIRGHRLIFEPEARAVEEATPEGGGELQRKIRVTGHSMRALLSLGGKLWTSGFYSVELLSHKFFRHLIPLFLLVAFLSNLALALLVPLMWIPLALQLLFYALGALGALARRSKIGRSKLLAVPYYFCLVNLAAFLGVLKMIVSPPLERWTPTRAD